MQVFINQISHELPSEATLEQALAQIKPSPPFAVAVNMQFVPKTQYALKTLAPLDNVEVIFPVTGG